MSESWKNNPDGEDVQMPLGTGDAGADAGYAEEPKPKMNTSTLALFASFLAALAVLYLLGLHNKPRAATAEQVANENRMNAAITEMLQKNGKAEQIQGLLNDTDRLVQMFYSYLQPSASKSAELPENPFAQQAAPVRTGNGEAVTLISTNANEAEALRRVAETFNTLKLQSVMVGSKQSVAMINNRMVQVGATFGELTVTSIEASRVILSYGKNNFELKISREK